MSDDFHAQMRLRDSIDLHLENHADARQALISAWPIIVDEVRAVLGGELLYQAVVYHCLRMAGVPRCQFGNVKQWIPGPVSLTFQAQVLRRHADYQGGFELIPDGVLFGSDIDGDWRRRYFVATLSHTLVALEIKASERAGGRISDAEVLRDIGKLDAHRIEVEHRHGRTIGAVMMIIDTAPRPEERMTDLSITRLRSRALEAAVDFFCVSESSNVFDCNIEYLSGDAGKTRSYGLN